MDDNVAQRLSLQRPGGNGAMFSFLGSGGRGFGGNGAAGPDKLAVLAEVRAYWEALRPDKENIAPLPPCLCRLSLWATLSSISASAKSNSSVAPIEQG